MKLLNLLLAICLFTCSVICFVVSAQQSSSPQPIVFENANIIDVESGQLLAKQFLVLEDGYIVHVGKSLPRAFFNLPKLDAAGQFVLPGLIDTHAHLTLGEVSFKKTRGKLAVHANSSDEIAKWNARELLRWGVTYIRNPGGSSKHNLDYKSKVATGKFHGPGAVIAGEILNQGEFSGLAVHIDKNMPLDKAIIAQKEAGIDIIKLYTGLSGEQIKKGIDLGHKYDMKVIGHLEDVSWTDAANWKIDGLVHPIPGSTQLLTADRRKDYEKNSRPGTFAHFEWYEHVDLNSPPMLELYRALTQNQVHVDPTLIVFKNSFYGDTEQVISHPRLKSVHPELLNNWKSFFNFNLGWQETDFQRAKSIWPKVLQFIHRLHQEGVPLTIGTDLGNPWVIPGFSVHQEMQLFADAGIPNADILKMATLVAAKQLDIADKHGSVEAGKVANLLFLSENPLIKIANTQSITQVYLAGTKIDSI